MSYSGLTPYLGLRLINLKSQSWYGDMHSNFERIDRLGRNYGIQPQDGYPMSIRVAMRDGTLAEAISFLPRTDGTLRITLGRPNQADSVQIAGSFLFTSVGITNQNALGSSRILRMYANYPANHHATITWNPNQATDTEVQFPNDELVPVAYEGSLFQLEANRSHIAGRVPFALTIVSKVGGEETEFVIPAYKRTT